jgi:hypothetical protein
MIVVADTTPLISLMKIDQKAQKMRKKTRSRVEFE